MVLFLNLWQNIRKLSTENFYGIDPRMKIKEKMETKCVHKMRWRSFKKPSFAKAKALTNKLLI